MVRGLDTTKTKKEKKKEKDYLAESGRLIGLGIGEIFKSKKKKSKKK